MALGFCRSSRIGRAFALAAPRLAILLLAILALAGCESLPQLSSSAKPNAAGEAAAAPPQPVLPQGAAPSGALEVQPLPPPGTAPETPQGGVAPSLVPPGGPAAVKVALLLPLSGPNAGIGRELLDAATLALFDLGDDRLTLLPHDTQGTPAGAAAAAQAALADGAALILGPLFSTEAAAVAPVAQARGINVISFSNDRSVAGNGVFILGFTPEQEIDQVLRFARASGYAKFAALTPDSPYGNAVVEALKGTLAKAGGEAVKLETYPTDGSDLGPIVKRFADADRRKTALAQQKQELANKTDEISQQALKRLDGVDAFGDVGFDALLLPEGGPRLKAIAPLLAFYEVDPSKVRFLGSGLWDEPGLGREPNLVGGWFAAPPQANESAFRDRFQKAYGHLPARIASLAYDAMALAAVLGKQDASTAFSHDAIANPNGFAGYDGIFRFGADGVAERGLAILEVTPRDFKVVRPAPDSFENLGQ